MKFKIPFLFSDLEKAKKRASPISKKIRYKKDSKLADNLRNSDINIKREDYIGICIRTLINVFFILFALFLIILAFMDIKYFYVFAFGLAFLFSLFVLFSQLYYPKLYSSKRQRDIEKNLIPALQDVLIQLNSGIPLFSIIVNLSASNYGELSKEFRKAAKRINTGEPEIDVLESLGERNPSPYFKRTLWQLSNGMRAGSDMQIIIKDSINSLSEEQLLQIQEYGNKLNPLVMFYMLISVIAPALAITFLTILSSMINLPGNTTKGMFIGLFIFVLLIQIMFLGIIKSKRPSLLK